eukprot:3077097-Pyramimonas_sp.AAC.1
MRVAREAIAVAMCRPSCGGRSSSGAAVAMLSWAGDTGEARWCNDCCCCRGWCCSCCRGCRCC